MTFTPPYEAHESWNVHVASGDGYRVWIVRDANLMPVCDCLDKAGATFVVAQLTEADALRARLKEVAEAATAYGRPFLRRYCEASCSEDFLELAAMARGEGE